MNETDLVAAGISPAVAKSIALAIVEDRLQREKKGRPRVTVSITRLSTGSLDPDNLQGSVKPLVDCLRHCGLIQDDRLEDITLNVDQARVKKRKDQGTLLTIEYA